MAKKVTLRRSASLSIDCAQVFSFYWKDHVRPFFFSPSSSPINAQTMSITFLSFLGMTIPIPLSPRQRTTRSALSPRGLYGVAPLGYRLSPAERIARDNPSPGGFFRKAIVSLDHRGPSLFFFHIRQKEFRTRCPPDFFLWAPILGDLFFVLGPVATAGCWIWCNHFTPR